jgi:hypothetical protein
LDLQEQGQGIGYEAWLADKIARNGGAWRVALIGAAQNTARQVGAQGQVSAMELFPAEAVSSPTVRPRLRSCAR